jgi:hypothetical protein
MSRRCPVVDLSVDLTATLWTVEQAAEAAQVKPNTVRNWKYRGRLEQAGTDWRGRPVFRAVDVIRAERATREKARRVYPVAA